MISSARTEAIQTAKNWIARNPVYLDTETTGTGPHDNIVEISIIDFDGSILLDRLVKPRGKVHPDAMAVHGITEEMTMNAPSWMEIWEEVESVLENRAVGIFNADFDLRMMQQSHARNWMQWKSPQGMEAFCIMKLYAQFYGQWNSRRGNYRWQSLENAGLQCGINLLNSHRAKDDALLTKSVFEFMAHQIA